MKIFLNDVLKTSFIIHFAFKKIIINYNIVKQTLISGCGCMSAYTYLEYWDGNWIDSHRCAGKRLLRLIALALNVDENFFERVGGLDEPTAHLRLLHYPGSVSLLCYPDPVCFCHINCSKTNFQLIRVYHLLLKRWKCTCRQ